MRQSRSYPQIGSAAISPPDTSPHAGPLPSPSQVPSHTLRLSCHSSVNPLPLLYTSHVAAEMSLALRGISRGELRAVAAGGARSGGNVAAEGATGASTAIDRVATDLATAATKSVAASGRMTAAGSGSQPSWASCPPVGAATTATTTASATTSPSDAMDVDHVATGAATKGSSKTGGGGHLGTSGRPDKGAPMAAATAHGGGGRGGGGGGGGSAKASKASSAGGSRGGKKADRKAAAAAAAAAAVRERQAQQLARQQAAAALVAAAAAEAAAAAVFACRWPIPPPPPPPPLIAPPSCRLVHLHLQRCHEVREGAGGHPIERGEG